VGPEGDLVAVDDALGEEWKGWVLALGRLGVVVDLTLDVVPTFQVAQTVVEDVDEETVAASLEDVLAASYSVSVFTDWGAPARVSVWLKERLGEGIAEQVVAETWGGRAADGPRNPVFGMAADNATEQLGVAGPWNERLPHFRLEFTPSNGDEQQSEYLLPVGHASAAWRALGEVRDAIAPVLQVGEVRTIGGDDLWLSETGGVDAVGFHFTWDNDDARVAPAVAAVEEALRPFGARPHWGKVFATGPDEIASAYPRLDDFRALVARVDPTGVFANGSVDTWLGIGR
jgi:xylitol oxidase